MSEKSETIRSLKNRGMEMVRSSVAQNGFLVQADQDDWSPPGESQNGRDFYHDKQRATAAYGNSQQILRSSTPPNGIERPNDQVAAVQQLESRISEPPTVIPIFVPGMRDEILTVVGAITQRQETVDQTSKRLQEIAKAGGNEQGFLYLASLSHVENNGKLFIPKNRLLKILTERLNIDFSSLEPGIHNYFDFASIVYQVSVQKSGFLKLDKTFSVELGIHVNKI